jgi:hypothetical protein
MRFMLTETIAPPAVNLHTTVAHLSISRSTSGGDLCGGVPVEL